MRSIFESAQSAEDADSAVSVQEESESKSRVSKLARRVIPAVVGIGIASLVGGWLLSRRRSTGQEETVRSDTATTSELSQFDEGSGGTNRRRIGYLVAIVGAIVAFRKFRNRRRE